MINNTIVAVFKSIALCAIIIMFMSFGTTMFVVFSTYSKLDSVCQLMQSELSRNNRMLDVSMTGENGFIKQLEDVCATTQAQGTTADGLNPIQLISLNKIEVITKDADTDETYVYYEDGEEKDNRDKLEPLGAYGTIKTLKITFDTNIVFTVIAGNNGGIGVARTQMGNNTFTITYNAPCLRYIK